MGKNRRVHEVVEELMSLHNLNEKDLAEKAGVSELVIRNYLTGLNKDSRNYATLKKKVTDAFGIGEDFFDENHIPVSDPVSKSENAPTEAVKPEKITTGKKRSRIKEKTSESIPSSSDEGTQLVFDIEGKISAEENQEKESLKLNPEDSEKDAKRKLQSKAGSSGKEVKLKTVDKTEDSGKVKKSAKSYEKDSDNKDSIISAIKLSGSKTKLSGKKKDISPEEVKEWASGFEREIKDFVGKAFEVLKESLNGNFSEDRSKPVYANKKIAELVELASKAKEDDLNLVIAMLKKLTK